MFRRIPALLAIVSLAIFLTSAFAVSGEQVTYSFDGDPNGSTPSARLIADANGNLYGTAASGCAFNYGCVFELSKVEDSWIETVLFNFSGPDGATPTTSLLLDAVGNLYGTTALGGDFNSGVAFQLTSTHGTWNETVLHSFGSGTDGYTPSELILDSTGNLYGITQFGGDSSSGPDNGGTVYRLTLTDGQWNETILYSFPGSFLGPDGDLPIGGLALDKTGNLYGVTQAGGVYGKGAVFTLTATAEGTFAESIIHSFHILDGNLPNSTPVFDSAGNLYGTTFFGGAVRDCPNEGCGVIYELKKNSDGTWTEILLRQLQKADGWEAVGPVVFDSVGNLYAAAQAGGAFTWGSIFQLSPRSQTPWPEHIIHYFANYPDGASPYAGVTFDSVGNLFGTTSGGGASQMGTIFEIPK